jgi:hypothetical protein
VYRVNSDTISGGFVGHHDGGNVFSICGVRAHLSLVCSMMRMFCFAVRHTVIWFSCVAPLGALVTYFLLSMSGTVSGTWVALLLIFSGGTFLYVSTVHILPEYSSASMKRRDVATFVFGILLPLVPSLLSIGHGH